MSFLQGFGRHFVTPVDRGYTVPPADVIPPTPPAVGGDSARIAEVLRLTKAALDAESERGRGCGMRNAALADLCLEIRTVLLTVTPERAS